MTVTTLNLKDLKDGTYDGQPINQIVYNDKLIYTKVADSITGPSCLISSLNSIAAFVAGGRVGSSYIGDIYNPSVQKVSETENKLSYNYSVSETQNTNTGLVLPINYNGITAAQLKIPFGFDLPNMGSFPLLERATSIKNTITKGSVINFVASLEATATLYEILATCPGVLSCSYGTNLTPRCIYLPLQIDYGDTAGIIQYSYFGSDGTGTSNFVVGLNNIESNWNPNNVQNIGALRFAVTILEDFTFTKETEKLKQWFLTYSDVILSGAASSFINGSYIPASTSQDYAGLAHLSANRAEADGTDLNLNINFFKSKAIPVVCDYQRLLINSKPYEEVPWGVSSSLIFDLNKKVYQNTISTDIFRQTPGLVEFPNYYYYGDTLQIVLTSQIGNTVYPDFEPRVVVVFTDGTTTEQPARFIETQTVDTRGSRELKKIYEIPLSVTWFAISTKRQIASFYFNFKQVLSPPEILSSVPSTTNTWGTDVTIYNPNDVAARCQFWPDDWGPADINFPIIGPHETYMVPAASGMGQIIRGIPWYGVAFRDISGNYADSPYIVVEALKPPELYHDDDDVCDIRVTNPNDIPVHVYWGPTLSSMNNIISLNGGTWQWVNVPNWNTTYYFCCVAEKYICSDAAAESAGPPN